MTVGTPSGSTSNGIPTMHRGNWLCMSGLATLADAACPETRALPGCGSSTCDSAALRCTNFDQSIDFTDRVARSQTTSIANSRVIWRWTASTFGARDKLGCSDRSTSILRLDRGDVCDRRPLTGQHDDRPCTRADTYR